MLAMQYAPYGASKEQLELFWSISDIHLTGIIICGLVWELPIVKHGVCSKATISETTELW